jgi:hypothetical protein
MQQSRTLSVGLDVRKESIAIAYIAPEYHAEVVSLGTIGTPNGQNIHAEFSHEGCN